MPDQLARSLQLRCALSQPKAHRLVVKDGRAKTLPLFGISECHFKRTARHAHALCGDTDAPTLQTTQGDAIALALFADQVLCRNAAVIKVDLRGVAAVLAQLVFQPRHYIARSVSRHQKRAHAFFARAFVGDGNHDRYIRILAAGDKLLHAVKHIGIAFARCRGAQAGSVRAHMRLSQAKRAQHFAARQGR